MTGITTIMTAIIITIAIGNKSEHTDPQVCLILFLIAEAPIF